MSVRAFLTSLALFVVYALLLLAVWDTLAMPMVDSRIALAIGIFSALLLSLNIYQVETRTVPRSERSRDDAPSLKKTLRSLEDLFLKIYKGAPVPYVIIDGKGMIVSANSAALRLFGVEEAVLRETSLFARLHGEAEQRVALIPQKFAQGLSVTDEEISILDTHGEVRWTLFSLFSFIDAHGARRGLATLVDVTKQKEIDKAKTEFVSLASHQLRTPIATIKWNTELLLMKYAEVLDSAALGYVDEVAAATLRMELLVSDFLNASRFELGTLSAELATVELTELIATIAQEFMPRAEAKGITLRLTHATSPLEVRTDPQFIRMSVGNLISNAVKYTDSGEVRVTTQVTREGIVITVSDSGMGIPEAEQEKIFSKIFRASNAQKHVPDGTGLGLYIAREAISILRGTITFMSKEGEGTTFTVTLPR